jgi:hypothetical protein
MLLLVDGYNVTMRDPATSGRSKESQREELLARLRVHARRIARGGAIVVVFDAHGELGRSSDSDGSIKVVYANVADDEIVERCSGSIGRVAVVTDDLHLRARISQDVGRHVEYRDGSSVYAETIAATPNAPRKAPLAREAGLPRGANKITKELKDLWLTEDD